ncbi:hypothetical protein WA026_005099 [Henosepilachna vigintioctopunctata]|uniref:Uncharacterized protein n=1 Tax=Henosepilachna vigintioctopunctata TaxID=420089 RepID=A0AAW1UUH1_9CUCU
MEFVENIFSNMNTTSCLQKFLCNIVSESSRNLKEGKASSTDKIVDGIISSPWIINQLQDTFMYTAFQNGVEEKTVSKSTQIVIFLKIAYDRLCLYYRVFF